MRWHVFCTISHCLFLTLWDNRWPARQRSRGDLSRWVFVRYAIGACSSPIVVRLTLSPKSWRRPPKWAGALPDGPRALPPASRPAGTPQPGGGTAARTESGIVENTLPPRGGTGETAWHRIPGPRVLQGGLRASSSQAVGGFEGTFKKREETQRKKLKLRL